MDVFKHMIIHYDMEPLLSLFSKENCLAYPTRELKNGDIIWVLLYCEKCKEDLCKFLFGEIPLSDLTDNSNCLIKMAIQRIARPFELELTDTIKYTKDDEPVKDAFMTHYDRPDIVNIYLNSNGFPNLKNFEEDFE